MNNIEWARKIKEVSVGYDNIPDEELCRILEKNEPFLDTFYSDERIRLCIEKEKYLKEAREEVETGMKSLEDPDWLGMNIVEANIRDTIENIIKNTFDMDEGIITEEYVGLEKSILEQHKLRMIFEAYEEALTEKDLVIDIKVKKKDY